MPSINSVKSFEISILNIPNRIDVVYLNFTINDFTHFKFPCYSFEIDKIMIKDFKHIINGDEKTLDLHFETLYNLIEFKKEYFSVYLMNSSNDLFQEHEIVFENNSIVRNGIRTFINNYKPLTEDELYILENYEYYLGVYYPTYIYDEIRGKYIGKKFGTKHNTLDILIYDLQKDNDKIIKLLIECLDKVNDMDLYSIAREFTYKLFREHKYISFEDLKNVFGRDYELLCDMVEGESNYNKDYIELLKILRH